MAPTCPARQAAGGVSAQDWLVRLGIDVATFCDMWGWGRLGLGSFGHGAVFKPGARSLRFLEIVLFVNVGVCV